MIELKHLVIQKSLTKIITLINQFNQINYFLEKLLYCIKIIMSSCMEENNKGICI